MLEAGFQIGHYRILRMLGSGGMADVYEAEDGKLGRRVALKILPPELARNPELITRFDTEVRAAALLNHRNIVTVFEVGHQDSYHYYSMRLLTGGDLRKRIAQGLTPLESAAILRELADAFVHAHGAGFVHRDVKPENVIFDEQGMPVLTDFGIAKALEKGASLTGTGVAVGTPRYISPEQARGIPVDTRADLYSLGVVFYEMLTGRPPYEAEESLAVILKHVSEPIPKLPPELSTLQTLIDRLMAKEPAGRMGTAQELLQTIDALDTTALAALSPVKRAQSAPVQRLLTVPAARKSTAPQTPAPAAPAAAKSASAAAAAQRSKLPAYALAAAMAVVAVAGAAWYLGLGPAVPVAAPVAADVPEPMAPAVTEPETPVMPAAIPAASEPRPADDAAAREAAAEAQRREQLRRQAQEEEARRNAEIQAKREEDERQRAAAAARKQQEEDARREQARREELRRQEEEQRAAAAEARRREEERRRQLERELEEDLERQFD